MEPITGRIIRNHLGVSATDLDGIVEHPHDAPLIRSDAEYLVDALPRVWPLRPGAESILWLTLHQLFDAWQERRMVVIIEIELVVADENAPIGRDCDITRSRRLPELGFHP